MHSALKIEANTHMMPEISSVLHYNGAEESFVTRLAHSLGFVHVAGEVGKCLFRGWLVTRGDFHSIFEDNSRHHLSTACSER